MNEGKREAREEETRPFWSHFIFHIILIGTPTRAALEVAESLVECAPKLVSTPSETKHCFIHLPIVDEPTGACGRFKEINSASDLVAKRGQNGQ